MLQDSIENQMTAEFYTIEHLFNSENRFQYILQWKINYTALSPLSSNFLT